MQKSPQKQKSPKKQHGPHDFEIPLPDRISISSLIGKGGENIRQHGQALGCSFHVDEGKRVLQVTKKNGFRGEQEIRRMLLLQPFEVEVPAEVQSNSLYGLLKKCGERYNCNLKFINRSRSILVTGLSEKLDHDTFVRQLQCDIRDCARQNVLTPIVLMFDARAKDADRVDFAVVDCDGEQKFRPECVIPVSIHPVYPIHRLEQTLKGGSIFDDYLGQRAKVQFRVGQLLLAKQPSNVKTVLDLRSLCEGEAFLKRKFVPGVTDVKEFSSLLATSTTEKARLFSVTIMRADKKFCLTLVDLSRTPSQSTKDACEDLKNGLGLFSLEGEDKRLMSLECWNVRVGKMMFAKF